MSTMSYFTAVLAAAAQPGEAPAGPRDWRAVAVDLDEVADVDALADALGDASEDEPPGSLVIAVLEREDEWFALARHGEDGLRVFVSDLEAAASSRYADLLLDAASSAARGAADDDGTDAADDGDDDGQDGAGDGGDGAAGVDDLGAARSPAADEDAPVPAVAGPSWAGDAALLLDVGVGAEELVETSEGNDPATALAVVGERVGFVDLLEALR